MPARPFKRAARAVERRRLSLRRAVRSARMFARGYRFAQRLPAPQPPLPARSPAPSGPLESYFDAHAEGPGITKWRHYFDIYERHLSRFRGQPVHVVEIGVLGGGSLRMWLEYFGEQAHVYGVDINPASKQLERERVQIFIGDQADPAFWRSFLERVPRIDVVIDDGGHFPDQQAVTLESLLTRISPGGVFVCEDIHGAFQPFHSFLDGFARPLNDVGMPGKHNPARTLHQQVASVHRYPILTVIEKAAACAPTFESPRHGSEWPE